MVQKIFKVTSKYLHIPVRSDDPESFYYIEVIADGKVKNEFLIGSAAPDEQFDFYAPLDMKRYATDAITLVCRQENVKSNLFDALIVGDELENRPELYPDLYKEEIRQQVHFSPTRGWLNDPNGLFYKDGVFHMYFQHNPFANHHFSTNVSWGHAVSADGVHFREYGDAIMPRSSRYHIASGSAIVDENNISGKGHGTVLAAYTDLSTHQYHGRPAITSGCGQMLMYSTNNGMTFHYFDEQAIISVPDFEQWRDPKILQLNDKTLCIAVYETFEGKNCISFYKSKDCKKWEFCSRIMDFYECPDLFKLKVTNTDEELWVVYGANGKYHIGRFEDFTFTPIEIEGYIDYGDAVYAGQTFNNYESDTKRIYTAWLRDYEHTWTYKADEPNRKYGFSQAMALFTELSIHKTKKGYRLFRAPIAALETLRDIGKDIMLNEATKANAPYEAVFTLRKDCDARIQVGAAWFTYDSKNHRIDSSSGKSYELCSDDDLSVRIIVDTRSAEIFLQSEITMSFSVKQAEIKADCGYLVDGKLYTLKSIWKK